MLLKPSKSYGCGYIGPVGFTVGWCVFLIGGLFAAACAVLTDFRTEEMDGYGMGFVLSGLACVLSGLFILIEE